MLSNCIFMAKANNRTRFVQLHCAVVNCSQIVSLWPKQTTSVALRCCHSWLWIALKLYLYGQSKQRIFFFAPAPPRCELLSNCIFMAKANNLQLDLHLMDLVVNCSQIVSLWPKQTTISASCWGNHWLWIALKLYLYGQSKQHRGGTASIMIVVNCSQIVSLWPKQTTASIRH